MKCKLCMGNKAHPTLKSTARNPPKQLLNEQASTAEVQLQQQSLRGRLQEKQTAKSWILIGEERPTTGEGEVMKPGDERWMECLLPTADSPSFRQIQVRGNMQLRGINNNISSGASTRQSHRHARHQVAYQTKRTS